MASFPTRKYVPGSRDARKSRSKRTEKFDFGTTVELHVFVHFIILGRGQSPLPKPYTIFFEIKKYEILHCKSMRTKKAHK